MSDPIHRAAAAAVCAALLAAFPSPASGHELRCEAEAGIATSAPGGVPALGADGLPVLAAPALPSAVVDRYPALVAVRLRVTNVLDEPSTMAALAAPSFPQGALVRGATLAKGTRFAPRATAEQVIVVRVGSQAECLALASGGAAPSCPAGGADLRFTVSHDAGATTCAARLRCAADRPPLPSWLGARQLGTPHDENGLGVAVDGAGNVHVAGTTWSTEHGPAPGVQGGLVVSLDRSGAPSTATFGMRTSQDFARANRVAADAAGSVVVAGWADGSRGVVRRHAPGGALVWERTLGFQAMAATMGPGGTVLAAAMEIDPYFGWQGTLVAKYDAAGNLVWQRSLTAAQEDQIAKSVAIDAAGNVLVAGVRVPRHGDTRHRAFLARLRPDGAVAWMRDLEVSSWEEAMDVAAAPDGSAVVAGYAVDLAGAQYAFVRNVDAAGTTRWTWIHRGVGYGVTYASGWGVAVDPVGGFWVAGTTQQTSAADLDAFVARLDAGGAERWLWTYGSSATDLGTGIALDRDGNAYLGGYTYGDFVQPSAGQGDVFVIRLGPDGLP